MLDEQTLKCLRQANVGAVLQLTRYQFTITKLLPTPRHGRVPPLSATVSWAGGFRGGRPPQSPSLKSIKWYWNAQKCIIFVENNQKFAGMVFPQAPSPCEERALRNPHSGTSFSISCSPTPSLITSSSGFYCRLPVYLSVCCLFFRTISPKPM